MFSLNNENNKTITNAVYDLTGILLLLLTKFNRI